MATITISGNASTVKDGVASSMTADFVAEVNHVIQFTRDVSDAYEVVSSSTAMFYFIANIGTDRVRIRVVCPTGYMFFGIPPGGHVLLPGAGGDDANGVSYFQHLSARSMSSNGSRLVVTIGVNDTN